MPLLKMLSRSRLYAFENTLNYIHNENKLKAGDLEFKPILHNIRSPTDDREQIVDAFIENEAYRPVTENRIYCFHTIISMGAGDKAKCTPEIMTSIINKYFELRGDVLAYGVAHFNSSSPHVHILESATRYRQNKSSSLRKSELTELKLELEQYVRELGLEHSFIEHGQGKSFLKEREEKLLQNGGVLLKDIVRQDIGKALKRAKSISEFKEILHEYNLVHYERKKDGIPTGVISESGKKYRFTTLNISIDDYLELENTKAIEREDELLKKLQSLRKTKQKNLNRTR